MAEVQGPTPARRIHDKANKILSCTEARVFYIRHTDGDGAESITRVEVFGEADYGKSGVAEDRLPGIWATANLRQIRENLRLVTKPQALDILAALEERGFAVNGKMVSSALGGAPLPDVSNVFEDVHKDPEKG